VLGVHQPVFQRRGGAEQLLQPRRVLGAGQLHDDAPLALALDDGLGDAQGVDAVAQRGDVLLQREVLDLLLDAAAAARRRRTSCRRRAPVVRVRSRNSRG
jgi:hypothetical protein